MSCLAQDTWYGAITRIEKKDIAILFDKSGFQIYQIEYDLGVDEAKLEGLSLLKELYIKKHLATDENRS